MSNNTEVSKGSWKKEVATYVIIIAVIVGGVYGFHFGLQAAMGTSTPIVVVTSGSMHPTYWEGDILFVKHASSDHINVNDVIVFFVVTPGLWGLDPSIPVVHRVIDKYEQNGQWYFITKGDNPDTNPWPDPEPIPYSNIIGKTVFSIPRIGLFILWLRSVFGVGGAQALLVFIIIIILVILIIDIALSARKEKEQEETEDQKIQKAEGGSEEGPGSQEL
ncbi:MAG: signal peptidase I [Promethearchaeota archaeon]